jgi:hypothetical protein
MGRTCLRPGIVALAFAVLASSAVGHWQEPPQPLKQLTLEQLANVEVVTASKEPEPLRRTPAAQRYTFLTNDDIRRSGVAKLPEALGGFRVWKLQGSTPTNRRGGSGSRNPALQISSGSHRRVKGLHHAVRRRTSAVPP